MRLTLLKIVKNHCWESLSQISQNQLKQIKYAKYISLLLMLNTRKIALKNCGWVAATQNWFVWTTTFVHGGFQTMSMRQKKSLNVFSMECKWLKVRVTEEHLCLIITCTCISSDSRVRWSRQLPSRNTWPEQQEREQEWEQQESCWLRGIMDWIHLNLLRSWHT